MKSTIVVTILLLAFTASGQAPVFEAAEARVSKTAPADSYAVLEGTRVEFRGASMLEMIAAAYHVPNKRVLGGPSWLDAHRFDVTARAPRDTPEDTVRVMLQGLLADRFKLEVRKEERPMPVFLLTVSKRGLRLKESSGDGPSGCDRDPSHQPNLGLICKHTTTAQIAEFLPQAAGAYLPHPVIDESGLKGSYDFSLEWTGRGLLRGGGDDTTKISLFDAVDKQLGLKLDPENRPMTVIVVDKVNQKPTDDPKAVTHALPPAPTEFEVATIRPMRPDSTRRESRFLPSGEIEWFGATLKEMIQQAYNVDLQDDDFLVGPKWLGSERFDLIAKSAPNVPFDAVQEMFKALLAERFKLKIHTEKQPVSVYALTAPKHPKLKESSADERTQCTPASVDGLRTFTCQNVTMAQFVERVRTTARGYLDHPVVDLTEMMGSYDFTIKWTPKGAMTVKSAEATTVGPGSASDPNGGITFFEAIDKQLGLKLGPQKYLMPVYVIDHVEQTPTEN